MHFAKFKINSIQFKKKSKKMGSKRCCVQEDSAQVMMPDWVSVRTMLWVLKAQGARVPSGYTCALATESGERESTALTPYITGSAFGRLPSHLLSIIHLSSNYL